MDIETKGFIITSHGDSTVGIQTAIWELTGGFFFNDEEELNDFKEALKDAFEYQSDTRVSVETYEERQAEIDEENKFINENIG